MEISVDKTFHVGFRFRVTHKALLLVASAFGRLKMSRPVVNTEAFRPTKILLAAKWGGRGCWRIRGGHRRKSQERRGGGGLDVKFKTYRGGIFYFLFFFNFFNDNYIK